MVHLLACSLFNRLTLLCLSSSVIPTHNRRNHLHAPHPVQVSNTKPTPTNAPMPPNSKSQSQTNHLKQFVKTTPLP